jgi:phenylpropionate dioxygenase-like ring-hydroxylating dioxygenase large terminal subunit
VTTISLHQVAFATTMTSYLQYLGFGNPKSASLDPSVPKQRPVRAIPASWYLAPEIFQLERRAIFSRRWLFMTHESRIPDPGDFLRYELADFDFLIIRDRQKEIRSFHNVCRHRAYSVVEKDVGNAKILSCRYHGWSYGLDGSLAKAPKYDVLDGFQKERNALFPIHVKVDSNGFIWINLDGQPEPEIPWRESFDGVDQQARFEQQQIDFSKYSLDHTYQLEARYNWKMASDNFNECYHCPTTHPDVPNFLTVDAHDMEFKGDSIQHDHGASAEAIARGLQVNTTYYFPNVSMSVT